MPLLSEDGRKASADLLFVLRRKDAGAFLVLAAEYGRLFRWYFVRATMPEWTAEDLAVELMEDIVLFKIDRYHGDTDGFHAWVVTLMRHTATDWWRKQKGATFEPIPDTMATEVPAEAIPDVETVLAVRQALAQLGQADRRILELRHSAEERSLKEIAAVLQIPEGAARVRYHRAKKRLEELLKSDRRVAERIANKSAGGD